MVEHLGHGVDGVAVEGRLGVLERLDLEVGDGRPADVGHRHAEHQRVDEVADHHVLLLHRLVLGEPLVGVQRVVVHRDHAEQVVVVLGDGLARPVAVDVADLEVLEVTAERAVDRCHADTLRSSPPGEPDRRPPLSRGFGPGHTGAVTMTAERHDDAAMHGRRGTRRRRRRCSPWRAGHGRASAAPGWRRRLRRRGTGGRHRRRRPTVRRGHGSGAVGRVRGHAEFLRRTWPRPTEGLSYRIDGHDDRAIDAEVADMEVGGPLMTGEVDGDRRT